MEPAVLQVSTEIAEALRQATAQYAAAVDQRDTELFLDAFLPEGELHIVREDAAPAHLHGSGELSRVIASISRYHHTHHQLGQSRFWQAGEQVQGETYCTARHVSGEQDALRQMTMFIRYRDVFRPGEDSRWRIATRHVLVDWTQSGSLTG
jgi:hypothetical protein